MTIRQTKNAKHQAEDAKPESGIHWLNHQLETLSHFVTQWAGSSWAFALALLIVGIWIVTGPIFNYSDTWQLVINTGTTIVTFLMVFLIQRTQNKDSLAIQVKLNELLAAQEGASNQLINVEDMSEEDILGLHQRFSTLSSHLAQVADDRNKHSIAEAQEGIEALKETLEQTEDKSSNGSSSQSGRTKPR